MKKRIVTILMSFILVIEMLAVVENVSAATPYLNYNSYSITGSYSFQLNLENSSEKVKWSSTNKKVAKVNKKGVVSSVSSGKCKIIAKVGKKKYKCHVTVEGLRKVSNKPYTKTTLDVSALKLDVSGIGYDNQGNAVIQAAKVNTFTLKLYNIPKKKKKNMKVTWSSSNENVAKVKKGIITPVNSGKATIVAEVNGKKYKCKVTITDFAKTVVNKTLGDLNSAAEQIDVQGNIYKTLKLINDARIKAEVAPVKLDENINKVAKVRAMEICPKDMSQTDETGLTLKMDDNFGHRRPNGTAYFTAYDECGVDLVGSYETAENIAHSSDRLENFPNAAEKVFHDFWMEEGHRKNIINKEHTSVGLGYYKVARFENEFGNVYIDAFWSQEFFGN